jgi:hypothetical protein
MRLRSASSKFNHLQRTKRSHAALIFGRGSCANTSYTTRRDGSSLSGTSPPGATTDVLTACPSACVPLRSTETVETGSLSCPTTSSHLSLPRSFHPLFSNMNHSWNPLLPSHSPLLIVILHPIFVASDIKPYSQNALWAQKTCPHAPRLSRVGTAPSINDLYTRSLRRSMSSQYTCLPNGTSICRQHWSQFEPARLGPGRLVDEEMCKIPEIQSQVARAHGIFNFISFMPGE